jgi:hypothetical protein
MKAIRENLGVIVCDHIAKDQCNISYASRSIPVMPQDTGWQFSCDKPGEENQSAAEIWSIKEVLAYDPTLARWIDAPFGTKLERLPNSLIWDRQT